MTAAVPARVVSEGSSGDPGGPGEDSVAVSHGSHRGPERRIRLALYVKGFPTTETGGPVGVAFSLAREFLRSSAIELILLVQTDAKEEDIRRALGGPKELTVIRLDYFPSPNDFRALPAVFRALRASDLVHFNEFPMRQVGFLVLAKAMGIPTVYSHHGMLSEEAVTFLGPNYPLRLFAGDGRLEIRAPKLVVSLLIRLYRWIAPHWSAVVGNSRAHLMRAVELEGFDPSRLRLIPHGVETQDLIPSALTSHEGPPRLLFVGKLERVKGPDLLLDALEDLGKDGVKADVSLVGGGSLEGELRGRARLLGHRVTFVGPVPHERMASFYEWSDIVVVPSRYESFGIVVLEAMVAGRPIVATDVGGIPEIVSSPRNAILVAPDPSSIAQGIRQLIEQPELRTAMAKVNLEDVQSYSWAGVAPRYLDLYRDLLDARASRPPGLRHPAPKEDRALSRSSRF